MQVEPYTRYYKYYSINTVLIKSYNKRCWCDIWERKKKTPICYVTLATAKYYKSSFFILAPPLFLFLIMSPISSSNSTCAPLHSLFTHLHAWNSLLLVKRADLSPCRLTRHPQCVSSRFLPRRVIDGPRARPCSPSDTPTHPQPYCLNRWMSLKDGEKKKKKNRICQPLEESWVTASSFER